jgi:regulatory protein
VSNRVVKETNMANESSAVDDHFEAESDGEEEQSQGLSGLLTPSDERALSRYLAGRDRAPMEIRTYLQKRGIMRSWHDRILERLGAMGLIDEDRFSANRIDHRLRGGQGPRRIEQELVALGIGREAARISLEAVESQAWMDRCLEVADEKLQSCMQREDARERVLQFLTYRGFLPNHIDYALKELRSAYPLWARRTKNLY